MSVKVREIYPGKWYLRITHQGVRKTKAVGSKQRALELQRKLTTALDLYGFDALKVVEEERERAVKGVGKPSPTVEQYQTTWLAEMEKTDLKLSTKQSYSYLMKKHIVPEFGKEKIDEIDYPRLKAWVIRQSGEYSKDSVRLMLAVLRTMLQEAVNKGILSTNPVMKLGKFYRSAKKVKDKIDPFTIEELRAIEAKCREKFSEHYGFVLTLARTGMRIGEVTALQWQDVDFGTTTSSSAGTSRTIARWKRPRRWQGSGRWT